MDGLFTTTWSMIIFPAIIVLGITGLMLGTDGKSGRLHMLSMFTFVLFIAVPFCAIMGYGYGGEQFGRLIAWAVRAPNPDRMTVVPVVEVPMLLGLCISGGLGYINRLWAMLDNYRLIHWANR